jgi:hypothetical protein
VHEKYCLGNLKGMGHMEDIGVDERMNLLPVKINNI